MEETFCNLSENHDQRFFLWLRNVDSIEKPHKSRRKLSPTISSTDDHLDPLNLLEYMSLSIPHSLVAEDKSQHFNRRLSSVLFYCWHVDVIDEVDELFTRRRDKCNRALFSEVLEFALELQLSHCWRGLSSESEGKIGLTASFDDLIDDASLACSGWRSDVNRVQLVNKLLYD